MITKSKKKKIEERPPVVVVLGHVDHGKSSILECIKDLKITTKESGGITQHIGAYEIEQGEGKITFIDTPGHEAFSMMRSRGADVADVAVLVIDACEGIRPQTEESILAVKKAGIPMIVALNKMDKPEADPEKVKRDLMGKEVVVESIGGDVPSVEVSSKTKQGIENLLELISLVSEMEELKNDLTRPAEGVIIESYMDSFKGPVSTLLLKKGILKEKDIIGTDSTYAKIKTLQNFKGERIKEVYPSQPAVVLGFEKVPRAGEEVKSYSGEQEALGNIEKNKDKTERNSPPSVFTEGDKKDVLNIVLKADVLGSLEALEKMFESLPQEKVTLRVLKSEVGEVNDSDLKLAETANAQIVGFRVKINSAVKSAVKKHTDKGIKIKTFDVIYELLEYVKSSMKKKIVPEVIRKDMGKMKVLVIFKTKKTRQIIGGKITEGEVTKGLKMDVYRDKEKMGEGKVISVQQNKREVEKLKKGEECGILYEGNVKVQKRDVLHFYIKEKQNKEI